MPCHCLLAASTHGMAGQPEHVLVACADALFLRQARDGTILISVYKEAYANELLPSPAAAEDPAELAAVGRQVGPWVLVTGISHAGINAAGECYRHACQGSTCVGCAHCMLTPTLRMP